VKKIAAISWVTFREALRQKLAVNLLVFAVALVSVSIIISRLTFGEQYRIIVDIGLSAMEIFGTLIAVFLGAGLIAREVERRTVYPIVAKPVSRAQYLVGRYLGLVTTTTLNLAVMALVFGVVLAIYTGGASFVGDAPFFLNVLSLVLRFAMIAAIAVFFSSFTTATLAAIFTLSLVVAGHVASDIVRYWGDLGGPVATIGKGIYVLVPNLEALNFKEAMVYKDAVPSGPIGLAFAYGILYSAAVVALSTAVFSKRDFK
jgi:ABC-type transport system involved in multi-copper enzyme maturation permease subunit